MIERMLERFLFASRWLLAPFYAALVLGLAGLLLKVIQALVHFVTHLFSGSEADSVLGVLSIVDLTLTGSLLVIVIFAGYENFVSKIDVKEHKDWPSWMGTIGFGGLKLKLMSSIVAISAIQLLRAFMDVKNNTDRDLQWYVVIHIVFVISSFLFAWSDRLGDEGEKSQVRESGDGQKS
jgi:uncharacterized protein (TIGR00645 family)